MSTGTVTLRASVKLPQMPNFVELQGLERTTLDEAIAKGGIRVDVGELDDQAISDFCTAWTVAFTRHAKARRPEKAVKQKSAADIEWQATRANCS